MSGSKYAATPQDGQEILRILESSAAKGNIELIYTRRPDAYESYKKDAKDARVFISRNGDRAIGTCAELIREVYIGGESRRAAYLCGLKKDAEYHGGVGFGARFIQGLQQDDIDFYYCSVVAENAEARQMFEKSRRLLSMQPISGYRTYILNPKIRINAPHHSFTFRQATEHDIEPLLTFLNAEGRKKDMFPVIRSLDDDYHLKAEDFYLLLDGTNILAVAALWKQTAYKQYVVKRYGTLMKLARLCNPLLSAMRYIRLPKENEPLDFPMLAFFLCREDNTAYFRIFLHEITHEIAKSYRMFVIGLPDCHAAKPMMDRLPSIRFETEIYGISFPWSGQVYQTPDPSRLFLECGLL